jgi:hypothetical protein
MLGLPRTRLAGRRWPGEMLRQTGSEPRKIDEPGPANALKQSSTATALWPIAGREPMNAIRRHSTATALWPIAVPQRGSESPRSSMI